MLEVIPGILEEDLTVIKRKLLKAAPYVEWVQIDLADGILVDNETFSDPQAFSDFQLPPFRELHMMVDNPIEQVDDWAESGFTRIISQIEGLKDPEAFIEAVGLHSIEAGLALDLSTPVSVIEPYLSMLDVVLLMSVEAGYSGQEFDPKVLNKIREVREIDEIIPIEIDGGINREAAGKCAEAGATRVVSTSYIYGAENIKEAIKELASSG